MKVVTAKFIRTHFKRNAFFMPQAPDESTYYVVTEVQLKDHVCIVVRTENNDIYMTITKDEYNTLGEAS